MDHFPWCNASSGDESLFAGCHDGGPTTGDPELAADMGHVVARGNGGNEQLFTNLVVRQAPGQALQDVQLSLGQGVHIGGAANLRGLRRNEMSCCLSFQG